MIALTRYTFANVALSQRYLPPLLVFFAVLFVFTGADSGPLLSVYAVSSAAVFGCGTWLAVAVVNAQDPVQWSVTVVNARGSGRVLVAAATVAFGWCVLLGVVGLLYPLAAGHHDVGPAVLVVGASAELTSACTGVAIGLLCSRLVIRRTGVAVLTALAAIMVVLLVPGVPPVRPVFRLLANATTPGGLLPPVLGFATVAVALVVAGVLLTRFVAVRRD